LIPIRQKRKKQEEMKNLFILLGFSAFINVASAQNMTELRKQQFNVSKDDLAIKGYDPVAYFNLGKAVEGKKENTATVNGITYRFSTPQNRDLFKADPAKFEPQYGGWCAYAMGASGEKVDINPGTFKIVNGKLFLFYHTWVNNTLNKWNADESNLHTKADASWKTIYH
jgi:YHS domain-containing protein